MALLSHVSIIEHNSIIVEHNDSDQEKQEIITQNTFMVTNC